MMMADDSEFDIENYMPEYHEYIHKALKDPMLVPKWWLEKVASAIVNRSWEDVGYYQTAARMCQIIIKKERDAQEDMEIPSETFMYTVHGTCQQLINDDLRGHDIRSWYEFLKFLNELILILQTSSTLKQIPRGLIKNASEACDMIVQENVQVNEENLEEIRLLCRLMINHGKDFPQSKISSQVNWIIDLYKRPDRPQELSKLFLCTFEVWAYRWELTEDLVEFYKDYLAERLALRRR